MTCGCCDGWYAATFFAHDINTAFFAHKNINNLTNMKKA